MKQKFHQHDTKVSSARNSGIVCINQGDCLHDIRSLSAWCRSIVLTQAGLWKNIPFTGELDYFVTFVNLTNN